MELDDVHQEVIDLGVAIDRHVKTLRGDIDGLRKKLVEIERIVRNLR